MKKVIFTLCMLLLCVTLAGCNKKEEFIFGNNEIVTISTTPVGGVETYEMYTINVTIYADGKVLLYADNFNRWMGEEEIPIEEFKIPPVMVENIKTTLFNENIPYLHENVGNKDKIDGTRKTITVYGTPRNHTVGGISPSNRQFNKAYDYIYEIVRENVFIYTTSIKEIQQEGYNNFQRRNVKITNNVDEVLLTDELINQVFYEEMNISDNDREVSVVIEFNAEGKNFLKEDTKSCEEEGKVYKLHINDSYETMVMIDYNITDGRLYFNGYTLEDAEDLVNRINEAIQ